MPNPFPGMNPYLENTRTWEGFHTVFIVELQQMLRRLLPPGFVASPETRIYIDTVRPSYKSDSVVLAEAVPTRSRVGTAVLERVRADVQPLEVEEDVEIREPFLEVRDQRIGGEEVIAVIELLSPANKETGKGREKYIPKRQQTLQSSAHLMEIDLLRGGEHTVYVPQSMIRARGPYDYLVTLADASRPNLKLFWRVPLDQPLPTLEFPLTPDVPPITLDLQVVLERCHLESGVDDRVNYRLEPDPPLTPEQARWSDALLRSAGLRP